MKSKKKKDSLIAKHDLIKNRFYCLPRAPCGTIHCEIMHVITTAHGPTREEMRVLSSLPEQDQNIFKICVLVHKCRSRTIPKYLYKLLIPKRYERNTRSKDHYLYEEWRTEENKRRKGHMM